MKDYEQIKEFTQSMKGFKIWLKHSQPNDKIDNKFVLKHMQEQFQKDTDKKLKIISKRISIVKGWLLSR